MSARVVLFLVSLCARVFVSFWFSLAYIRAIGAWLRSKLHLSAFRNNGRCVWMEFLPSPFSIRQGFGASDAFDGLRTYSAGIAYSKTPCVQIDAEVPSLHPLEVSHIIELAIFCLYMLLRWPLLRFEQVRDFCAIPRVGKFCFLRWAV